MSEVTTVGTPNLNSAEDSVYNQLLDIVSHNLSLLDIRDTLHRVNVLSSTGKTLYQHYLSLWPEEQRQQFTCITCRRWLDKYGQYVTINDGILTSVAFSPIVEGAEGSAYDLLAKLKAVVEKSQVVNLVHDSEETYAVAHNGKFKHFHGVLNCEDKSFVLKHDDLVIEGLNGRAKENVKVVENYLTVWAQPVLEKVRVHFEHGSLTKIDKKHAAAFKQFYDLYREYNASKNNRVRENLIWEAIGVNNISLLHFRGTAVGTLLDNFQSGSEEYALRSFLKQVDPQYYMRPTEAPADHELEKAKKLVDELGLESAFSRRYASTEDVQYWFWEKPEAVAAAAEEKKTSIFDNVKTKDGGGKVAAQLPEPTNGGTLSVVRWVNEVLPKVSKLYFRPHQERYRDLNFNFSQFVTATDPESVPLLRWDSLTARNPVSNYGYVRGAPLKQWVIGPVNDIEILGITTSPEHWANPVMKYGAPEAGLFIVLDNFQDHANGSLGLFPETIRHELRDIRRVVEEYSNTNKLGDLPEGTASAAGIYIAGQVENVATQVGQFQLLSVMENGDRVLHTLSTYF